MAKGKPKCRFVVLASLCVLLLVLLGLSPIQALWTTALVGGAAFSGLCLVAVIVGPRLRQVESLAIALPLGVVLQALGYLVLNPWFSARVVFAITMLLSIVIWLARSERSLVSLLPRFGDAPTGTIVALGMVAGSIGALSFWLRHRLNWSGILDVHDDIVYHEALIGAAHGGWPVNSPLLGREPLSYHWLPNLWAAFIDAAVGLPPFAAVTRALPLVAILGAAVAAAAWAMRLSAHHLAGPTAAVGISTVGFIGLGPQAGIPLPPESPSEMFGAMLMLMLCLVVWVYRHGDLTSRAYGFILFVGLFALTGSKLSQAVIVLSGIGALVIGERLRGLRSANLAAHGFGLVGFVGGFLIFHYRGDRHDLSFHPIESVLSGLEALFALSPAVPNALLTVVAIGAPLLAALWALRQHAGVDLFVLGSVSAGVFFAITTTSPGTSERYFLSAALKVLIVVASVGVASLFGESWSSRNLGSSRLMRAAVIGTICTTSVTTTYFLDAGILSTTAARVVVLLVGGGIVGASLTDRTSLRFTSAGFFLVAALSTVLGSLVLAAGNVRLESDDHAFDAVRSDAFAIGAELRAISERDELVVTNRFCRDVREEWPDCKTKWFEASAASGRRALIEGVDYAVGTSRPPEALRLVQLSQRAAVDAEPDALAEVYALGVRWIWFDRLVGRQPEWGDLGEVRFSNNSVVIVELSPSLSSSDVNQKGE